MNKKLFCVIAALSATWLCGCGAMSEGPGMDTMSTTDSPFNMMETPYLDTSDLTYDGQVEQRIAIGYSFENPEDNEPVLIFDKYVSPDGEVFCFDDQGRLRFYKNTDDIFFDRKKADDVQTARTTKAENQNIATAVFKATVNADSTYEITTPESYVYNIDCTDESNAGSGALIKMNAYGEIRTISISFNSVTAPIDYDYFESKVQEHIDSVGERYDVKSSEYTVSYEQIDNKIYAMFTCTFEVNEDEYGVCDAFCTGVGFTQTITPSDHEVS